MKVIIAGSTGMVGSLILDYCLNDDKINEAISIVRKPTGLSHKKLNEVVIQDFTDYSSHDTLFQNIDAAFFCIGVYTGQVPDHLFKKITVDYAVKFAEALKAFSPKAALCLLSGAGADKTEKSRTSFARYKGMAENQIEALSLDFYTFRPAYIYPVTPREEPNFMYSISRKLYPIFKLLGENASITSEELARAMFHIGMNRTNKKILGNRDILKFA